MDSVRERKEKKSICVIMGKRHRQRQNRAFIKKSLCCETIDADPYCFHLELLKTEIQCKRSSLANRKVSSFIIARLGHMW